MQLFVLFAKLKTQIQKTESCVITYSRRETQHVNNFEVTREKLRI